MPKTPRLNAYQRAVAQLVQDRRQGWVERKIVKQKNDAGLTPREEQGLLKRSLNQIRGRSLAIPYGFESYRNGREITDRTKKPSMWLFHTSYRARYTSGEEWWIRASYLCGYSDGQDWAVRVPGTLITVDAALHWITPAQVRRAQEKGRTVHRQGDVYFIPLNIPAHDFSAIEHSNHRPIYDWRGPGNELRLSVVHPEHPTVVLDTSLNWRAVQQKQLSVAGRRTGAD